ncbi:neuron navigator 1 [Hemiscyllium ocellatum]|uniref:neuron navigator 1 n=1 Tax=Hemiscyllium ocellatum TaxID=170820 RepID=UPI0029674313|nr:neuron navigator 1 [Hemiscyllium ocellatum]
MLGANVKCCETEICDENPEDVKVYKRQADGKGTGQHGKKGKPPTMHRATELKVFKGGTNLRKQKSLTNLSFLTDAEKKMQLYEPKWCDDMSKSAQTLGKGGFKHKDAPMSKSLSKSEHSLFQGKLAPSVNKPLAAPSTRGIPSRIPRGPWAEVKPLSKSTEASTGDGSKSDDEILSSKAKNVKKPTPATSKSQQPEEKAYLKVDPELVVTVLGDLEQLLFSQMLDPETQRKRTVQNIVDLRQNLEDTMSSLRGSQITHSALDSTFDSDISAEMNARSRGTSSSNRSSPLSWRYGQASPRLQAGDAPSVGSGCQPGGNSGWFVRGDSSHYSHTMPMRSSSKSCNISHLDLESLDTDDVDLKSISADMSGYMSDSDLMGKTMNDDDITTG